MKNMTEVNNLKEIIFARKERIAAIHRQADLIKTLAPSMNLKQLLAAKAEVADLNKELEEHLSFIAQAKKEINAFFAPAVA